MNKFLISSGTMVFALITDAIASSKAPTAEATGLLFQRYFKKLRCHRTAQLKTDPIASVDSQLIDEKGLQQDKYQSPLYNLAASNPYVIASSLFSRKHR